MAKPNGESQKAPQPDQAVEDDYQRVTCGECRADITAACMVVAVPVPVGVLPDGEIVLKESTRFVFPMACPACGAPKIKREPPARVQAAPGIIVPSR